MESDVNGLSLYDGVWRTTLFVGRVVISFALCFSGLIHINNPYGFLVSVLEYRYLEPGVATSVISTVLPALQVAIGVSVVLEPPFRSAMIIASCMFSFFFLAQLGAWWRGLPIDCGCFGSLSHSVGAPSLSLTALLGLLSIACVILRHRQEDAIVP